MTSLTLKFLTLKETLLLAILIIISCGLFFFAGGVLAKEGDCHLDFCLIPAPTVISKIDGQVFAYDEKIVVSGLTWKTTIVKVFVDGKEIKNVRLTKHADFYADFAVTLPSYLKAGKHTLYTIAYSEKPTVLDQSQESTYLNFEILPKPLPVGKCNLDFCLVPTPTIIYPSENQIFASDEKIIIAGLTWKTAPVKVFVDNQEVKNVRFTKHADFYADFAVFLEPLPAGQHSFYAIAYSEVPSIYGQSFETRKINFTVSDFAVNELSTNFEAPEEIIPTSTPEEPVTISEPVVEEVPIVVSDEVTENIEEPIVVTEEPDTRIEGGVTAEAETVDQDLINQEFSGPADPIRRQQVLTRNRIVGSVILFFIVLWLVISKLLTVIKKHDKLITSIDLSLDQEPENDVKPLDPTPAPTETYWANPQVGTDKETSLGEKREDV
jgi:hypothetical protein